MAKTIKSIGELSTIIKPYIVKAMELTRDEISNIIQKHVIEYYDDYEPKKYVRTYKLMNAIPSHTYPVEVNGNEYSFKVGFGDDYMTFRYKVGQKPTGREVFTWADNFTHGGNVDGNVAIWKQAMYEIEERHGSIENLFIFNLRRVGLKIK